MCRFLRRVATHAVVLSRGLALQKRQGTKSRDVELRRCDERYGDLGRARVFGLEVVGSEQTHSLAVSRLAGGGKQLGDGRLMAFGGVDCELARRSGRAGALPR